MSPTEIDLRFKCEELQERIRQLEDILIPTVRVPVEWGLTKQEAQLFAALTRREWVTRLALDEAVRVRSQSEGGGIVNVIIARIRSKTARFGVTIKTVWGEGYKLVDRDRWVRELA